MDIVSIDMVIGFISGVLVIVAYQYGKWEGCKNARELNREIKQLKEALQISRSINYINKINK